MSVTCDYGPKTSFSDIILVSESKEFYTHKIILCQNSPYLAKIITSEEFTKFPNQKLDIGFTPMTTKLFLDIIYKSEIKDFTLDIIPMADKYNVGLIKNICFEYLDKIKEVNEKNINSLISYTKYGFVREKLSDMIIPYLVENPTINKLRIVMTNHFEHDSIKDIYYTGDWVCKTLKENYENTNIGFINFGMYKMLYETRITTQEACHLTEKWMIESETDRSLEVVEYLVEHEPIPHIMEIASKFIKNNEIRSRIMMCLREHLKIIVKNMKDNN